MNEVIKARIEWLPKEQGGRKSGLPYGDKYAPTIRHTKPIQKPLPWKDSESSWSLLVENKEIVSEFETIAEIKYLSEEAPDNLIKNVEFELYEGNKMVAKGIIF